MALASGAEFDAAKSSLLPQQIFDQTRRFPQSSGSDMWRSIA